MAGLILNQRNTIIFLLCSVLRTDSINVYRDSNETLRSSEFTKGPLFLDTHSLPPQSRWMEIAAIATGVFMEQNDIKSLSTENHYQSFILIILFDMSAMEAATKLIDSLSTSFSHMQYISFLFDDEELNVKYSKQMKDVFLVNCNTIRTVVVLSENSSSIVDLLRTVSSTQELALTGIIHTTEWMIVSTCSYAIMVDLLEIQSSVDFITLLFRSSNSVISVAQKSRTEILKIKVHVFSLDYTRHCARCMYTTDGAYGIRGLCAIGKLRKSSVIFLGSEKSIISGMKMRAALISNDKPDKGVEALKGSAVTMDSYSLAILHTLSISMDFQYAIVIVQDSGHYGRVKEGQANGIVGLLARKEVALTTVPLSRTDSRIHLHDFIPVMTFRDTIYSVYRLTESENDIDLIYIHIFAPELAYTLLVAALGLAIIGAMVHVMTHSCTLAFPQSLSRLDARHLLSYPDHICFHTSTNYPGQTGRVLRATWGLFWLIICSGYSAFLVTSFATKPPEQPLNTFELLADNKDLTIGSLSSASAFLDVLQFSTNTSVQKLYKKFLMQNKTDVAYDKTYDSHINKIKNGHYAFISSFCVTLGACNELFLDEHMEDIRAYPLNIEQLSDYAYSATPRNVFYGDALYRVLLDCEEKGILQYLKNYHYRAQMVNKMGSSKHTQNKAVSFSRIRLPVYVALVGASVGVVCLGLEIVYQKWRAWRKKHLGLRLSCNKDNPHCSGVQPAFENWITE